MILRLCRWNGQTARTLTVRSFLGLLTLTAAIYLPAVMMSGAAYADWGLFRGEAQKVEAEPNHEYYLTDSDGLWFINAKMFAGEDARRNANRVVYELRKRYKLPAYIYKFDSEWDDLSQLAKDRNSKATYHYQNTVPSKYAVLVGSFPSAEDPKLQETLLKIKRSKLDSLKNDRESQQLINEYEYLAKKDKEYTGYGPLGKALAIPNPLIPKEFFSMKGVVDPFIERINSDSPYNLLNNQAMYTVRVATFAGNDAYAKDWDEKHNRLELAGIKAALLCETLRKKGVDAWEFHDRDASFVTIGSFNTYGVSNPDGTTELNPDIYKLMEQYRGELLDADGRFQTHAIKLTIENPKAKGFDTNAKKLEMELSFDLQPVIIMVPQRPSNAKKVLQAQKKIQQDQENAERQRLSETLAINSEEHSRKYIETAQAKVNAEAAQVFQSQAAGTNAAGNTLANGQVKGQGTAGSTKVGYPPQAQTQLAGRTQASQAQPGYAVGQQVQNPQVQNQYQSAQVNNQRQMSQQMNQQVQYQQVQSQQRQPAVQQRTYAQPQRVANGMNAPTY